MKKLFFLFMLTIASLKIHAEFNNEFETFKQEMLDKFSCNSIENCQNKNLNANEFQNKYKELTYSVQSKYRKAMKNYDNQTNFINAFKQQISQLEKDLISDALQKNNQLSIKPIIAGALGVLALPAKNYFWPKERTFGQLEEKKSLISSENIIYGLSIAGLGYLTYRATKSYVKEPNEHALNQLDQMHKIRDWIVYHNNEYLAAKNGIKLVKPE